MLRQSEADGRRACGKKVGRRVGSATRRAQGLGEGSDRGGADR